MSPALLPCVVAGFHANDHGQGLKVSKNAIPKETPKPLLLATGQEKKNG